MAAYDFQRAVADGATLPLTYENRGKKLGLDNPELNRIIEERIDAARADGELSEEQEAKLYRELARDYLILTSEPHLTDVATDLVEHYHGRWRLMEPPGKPGQPPVYGGKGKALLVCIDKVTCVKMALLIRAKWQEKIEQLEQKLARQEAPFIAKGKAPPAILERDAAQIRWMKATQIHPVFSHEQNEVKEFAAQKLDVTPFRKIIAKGIDNTKLEDCFKDANHPFRVAIVCAMWLTGFDVKSLATLYLDKPMRGHTLMQAIARVNRVAPHKKNGLIIDYNGMLKSLRAAMSAYGQAGASGQDELVLADVFDERQSLLEYCAAIARVQAHLASLGFDLQTLIDAEPGEPSNQALLDAQRALCRDETGKKTFQVLAEDMQDRYRGLFPNPALFEYDPQERAISAIYNLLQKPKPRVDISAIMEDLRGIIDVMVETVPQSLAEQKRGEYDLSGIDFERLRVEFAKSPYKETATRTLQERIAARLAQMLHDNPGRVDLYERYQKIIAEFNRDKDQAEIERMFDSLLDFHSTLDHEQARFTREGLHSEKELAVFDLLSKDKADLSKSDIAKIKAVAVALMANISERQAQMIRLHDRASAQAQIRNLIIKQMLDGMPEGFSSDEIELRATWVYQHLGNTAQAVVLH